MQKVSRFLIVFVNILFLMLGIAVVVLGAYGLVKGGQAVKGAKLLKQLDIVLIGAIVTASGAVTIVTAFAGLLGACKQWAKCLKAYALVLFIVCAIQLAMGIYLSTLTLGDLQTTWEEDSDEGLERRISYQDFFDCCGWNYLTDSLGYLNTPCINAGYIFLTCRDATLNYIHDYVDPVAVGATIVASVELVAMSLACFVIMTQKGDVENFYDDPFHY
jgi:hypothetical protein